MPATEVKPSFPTFFDRDGSPLENGYIFIGIENQNPEVRTSRQQAYWDIGLTIPAAQPIRTIGGYASRNGSPGQLFTDDKHSLTVRDKNMRLIYTSATNLPLTGDLTGNVTGNLTGNVTGNVTGNLVGGTASLTTPLPITSGGTGANTAAGALTALGATTVGSAVFTAADGDAAVNALGFITSGEMTTTITASTSGSVTLSSAFAQDKLAWYRVGDLVNVYGKLEVASVASPVGSIFVALPFASAQTDGSASLGVGAHTCWVFDTSEGINIPYTFIVGASTARGQIGSSGVFAIAAGDSIRINITYRVAP
jgi:hypothetical protein